MTNTAPNCFLLFVCAFMASCTSPSYESPPINTQEVLLAQRIASEVQKPDIPERITDEKEALFDQTRRDLIPAATNVCALVAERAISDCLWTLKLEENDEFNAHATNRNEIVINSGVLNGVANKEELGLVMAHEISHHIANHIEETSRNVGLGATIGALTGVAIAAATGDLDDDDHVADLLKDGADYGVKFAYYKFNKAQEAEADLLAVHILKNANYDLDKSKVALIRLAELSNDKSTRSSFFDTHPTGWERIAAYEKHRESVALQENRKLNPASNLRDTRSGVVGEFERAAGSYCIYLVDGVKKAVPRNDYCPSTMQF